MRIRVLGGGWFGCHIASTLLADGHDVELHEMTRRLFSGASGNNPARCHLGFHYPRSHLTRAACQAHQAEFLRVYGGLTRAVPVNLYAVAAHDSFVDFGTYTKVLRGDVAFVEVHDPREFGLCNVEGAVLTGERHIVIDAARVHFESALGDRVRYGVSALAVDDRRWDLTIDCTFCALDGANVDRYEPCLTVLLEGSTERAVTIMDGPFGSVYPWNEDKRLSSLTSASLTPFSKTCRTWQAARAVLDGLSAADLEQRAEAMLAQMAHFWPEVRDRYRVADYRLSIRAMPRSAADARLPDIIQVGKRALRVRAGKIDAIFAATREVQALLPGFASAKVSRKRRAA